MRSPDRRKQRRRSTNDLHRRAQTQLQTVAVLLQQGGLQRAPRGGRYVFNVDRQAWATCSVCTVRCESQSSVKVKKWWRWRQPSTGPSVRCGQQHRLQHCSVTSRVEDMVMHPACTLCSVLLSYSNPSVNDIVQETNHRLTTCYNKSIITTKKLSLTTTFT